MIRVKKYSGELVPYDPDKFKHSLLKSGASRRAVEMIASSIAEVLYDGIHTKELYRLAHSQLKRQSSSFAARYSLKRALRDLGPTGYHFEKWTARIFEHMGYRTKTSQMLQGRAVTHEIDVLAWKEDALSIMECKFKNTTESRISVTTPMYYLSRIKDLEGLSFEAFDAFSPVKNGWLVTNAYLTSDSIRFVEHYGIHVLSWEYPEGNNIKNWVDHAGLYPLTCLTTLTKAQKKLLLEADCILVKDIVADESLLDPLNLTQNKKRKLVEEATALVDVAY